MKLPFMSSKKSQDELEEEAEYKRAENESLEQELTATQRRVAIARLKENGLSPKHFGMDWKRILQWIKEH